MQQLRDGTHLILDGEVRVYRRERSKRWLNTVLAEFWANTVGDT